MRYSALNQGGDSLASFAGFIPADVPAFKTLPDPADPIKVGGRYSDEQLYALALYLYSLKPPPNPNKIDAAAERGSKVFSREGCSGCHTPPIYTNNKLTPAPGFTVPKDHWAKYDILPMSVGTEPGLTMETRRGTGYYKVPSFEGSGIAACSATVAGARRWRTGLTLTRLNQDYVPTGFKPYGAGPIPVKGHSFGLNLSAAEKKDLIAFLKTL